MARSAAALGGLMLMVTGRLDLLAGGSIYGGNTVIAQTSAGEAVLATPFNPAFVGYSEVNVTTIDGARNVYAPWDVANNRSLFAFGPPTAGILREAGASPARFYAAAGDIVDLRIGELIEGAAVGLKWYIGAAPTWVVAGDDIIDTGSSLGTNYARTDTFDFSARYSGTATGGLFVHSHETDVSRVAAGGSILTSSFNVAGPGQLELSAGESIIMNDLAQLTSHGPALASDNRADASITLMAGMANGVDWDAVRSRYLDPANLADPERPLADQPGRAAKVYTLELADWLGGRYGFAGTAAEALAYFDALAPDQQRIFLRQVHYAELREGGREYNDADGPRFGSYLRGREMIATLFPDEDLAGNAIDRSGDIILFGGSGVRSNFGGDIEMLAPGGQIIVGVQGEVPPASAGVMTQGEGDIRLFSEQSLLLGLSRIMTTFGGDIFAWSEQGDINAGRGAKTTVLYTPPKRTYDSVGNVTLAPQVPSSGAGIATLNPIPEVPPGDIDLIAPLGIIDAGEAGIRVSGNVNLAALQVVNAENIQV